jgi:hypothetical protein
VSSAVRPAVTPAAPVTEIEFSDVSSKPRRRAGWATAAAITLLAIGATVTAARALRSKDAPVEPNAAALPESAAAIGAPSNLPPVASIAPAASSAPAAQPSAAPAPTRATRWRAPARKPECKLERYVDKDGIVRFKNVCK